MSVLRSAQPSDPNQLLTWVADYHAFEGINSDQAHRLGAISPLIDGSPHGDVHIITQHGVDVGYVIFCYGWSIEFGGAEAILDELYLCPTMRGRGLGTIALRESIAALKVAGIILITLEVDHSNLAAQSLYRDMGFELREKYGYMSLKL